MEDVPLRLPSPLTELRTDAFERSGVRVHLKRDDLIHPDLTGNKWRKLKYNLAAAREQGFSTLLTFGGAYSNHIRATAAAGHYFGFNTVGIIRGEEHLPLNPSLSYAIDRGMTLRYLDRDRYRRKTSPEVLDEIRAEFSDSYVIPEGGSNSLALRGCAELVDELDIEYGLICCPCGTGGTLAGIAANLPTGKRALGFSALKGGDFLDDEVVRLQEEAIGTRTHNWSINTDFHFGGFAKRKPQLDDFISVFQSDHDIQLEWIYVAKMMYGLLSLIEQGAIRDTTVVALITG